MKTKGSHNLGEELKNNGVAGLLKRLFYYLPNHMVINRVKNAPLEYGLNRAENRERKVILSMTSYPPRFKNIYLCLKSLLLQSEKPDRIILWLGSDAPPESLTPQMRSLEKYGVEFRFDSEKNLMPHKKYYYAFRDFPRDIVVTVDDDVVYPRGFLHSLLKAHRKCPKAVCARRVHKITLTPDGRLKKYALWKSECRRVFGPSKALLAVGVGGILYPPGCVDSAALDSALIEKLCLKADDIWLKVMETKKGTEVLWVPCFFVHPPALAIDQSLWQDNVGENRNDVYINNLVEYYGLDPKKCFEDVK